METDQLTSIIRAKYAVLAKTDMLLRRGNSQPRSSDSKETGGNHAR
jgi:hypothetical protein